MLATLLIIMLTWLVLASLLAGIGTWFYRAFDRKADTGEAWILAFWAGFAFSLIVLQLWNIAFPVNNALRVLLAGLGILGLIFHWRGGFKALKSIRPKHSLFIVFALLFTVWLANRSVDNAVVYETGLYHLNVMQWAQEYRLLPGLGNLHSRLGFGTTYFLFPTLFNIAYWQDRAHHIANSLIYWVLFLHMAWSGFVILQRRRVDLYNGVQAIWMLVTWLLIPTETILPSMANDPVIMALGFVIAGQALKLIDSPQMPHRDALYRVFLIVLISGIGTAIKFSFLIYGALLSLLMTWLWIQRYGTWKPLPVIRLVGFMGIVAFSALIPMMARSVIATGYPLYPLTLAPFPVDWRIYPEHADLEYAFIRLFARDQEMHPLYVPDNWNWFPVWLYERLFPDLTRDYIYFLLPVVVAAGSAMLLAIRYMLRYTAPTTEETTSPQLTLLHWLFVIPALVAIAFWFYSAPAPRFAGASLWILAATLAVYLFIEIGWGKRAWQIAIMVVVYIMVGVLPFLSNEEIAFWITSGNRDGLTTLPKPYIKSYTSDFGLTVYYPIEQNQCWDAPLPCTPYPHPSMRLRVDGDMSQGFQLILREGDRPQIVE